MALASSSWPQSRIVKSADVYYNNSTRACIPPAATRRAPTIRACVFCRGHLPRLCPGAVSVDNGVHGSAGVRVHAPRRRQPAGQTGAVVGTNVCNMCIHAFKRGKGERGAKVPKLATRIAAPVSPRVCWTTSSRPLLMPRVATPSHHCVNVVQRLVSATECRNVVQHTKNDTCRCSEQFSGMTAVDSSPTWRVYGWACALAGRVSRCCSYRCCLLALRQNQLCAVPAALREPQ